MTPTQRTARVAGLLYLAVVLTGPFILIYVPGKLFVPGDATATAGNILTHESLFRAYIVVGLIAELCFIAVVLALYELLKGVNIRLAAVMVVLVLIDAPLALLGVANDLATLAFVRGAEFLAVFDASQRDALATLLINVDRQGVLVSELFWGLWLLPLGLLVYRSGMIPRFLGVWLLINGLAYVTISATGLVLPQHLEAVSTVAIPALFGEVAFMLWLLIVGVRPPPRLKAPAGTEGDANSAQPSLRTESEPPPATSEWGWRYHHVGIPTTEPRPGERYLRQHKFHVAGFERSPYGIEWMRFDADCPVEDLIQRTPHLAFEVDDIEAAVDGKEILVAPTELYPGARVAMIVSDGAPVELLEFETIRDDG